MRASIISRAVNWTKLQLRTRKQNNHPVAERATMRTAIASLLLSPFLLTAPAVITTTGCGEISELVEQGIDAAKCGIPKVRNELKACGESSRDVSISLKLEYLEGKEPLPDYELDYINEITALLEQIAGRMVKGDISLKITLKIKPSDKLDIETKIEDYSACGAKMTVEVSLPSNYPISTPMRYLVQNFFDLIFQHAENNLIPEHILGNLDNIIAQHAKKRARLEFCEEDHGISKEDWDWVHENLICGDGLNLEIPGQYEWGIGEVYEGLYEYDKAIKAYKKTIEDYPDSPYAKDAWYQLHIADLYIDWARSIDRNSVNEENETVYRMAIEEYNKVLDLENYPDAEDELRAEAQWSIGFCHRQLGELGKAIEAYKNAIENYPDSFYAEDSWRHYLIASVCTEWAKQNGNDEYFLRMAIDEYNKSLELESRSDEANGSSCAHTLREIGECHELLGEYDKAIEAYRNIFRYYPDHASDRYQLKIANLHLDWAKENGNDENLLRTAIDEFIIFLEYYPGAADKFRAEAQFNIGVCHELLSELDEAIEAYQKVIEYYPDSSWADDAWEALERLGQNL